MKRKMTRTLSLILTVLMLVSAFSVITLADTPVFLTDYVDPTGTIKNSAYLYAPSLVGNVGDEYLAEWEGTTYSFEIGVNAFATLDEIFEAAITNPNVGDYPQILFPAGEYTTRLDINQGCEIYGSNWNTNPSITTPTDYTGDWEENPEWAANGETIMSGPIVVGAQLTGYLSIMGITMNCRFYDTQRGVSGAGTEIILKNILVNHTTTLGSDGIPAPSGTFSNDRYVFSFQNYNNFNTTASASVNKDSVELINMRVKRIRTADSNRLIHEYIPPYFTIDGMYIDRSECGLATFSFFKVSQYLPDAKLTIKNSNFRNMNTTITAEGYNKAAIGTLEGQTSEIEVNNNLFYNCGTVYVLNIYMHAYSRVNMHHNDFFVTSSSSNKPYMSNGTLNDVDLTDAVSFTYNRVIGYTGTSYEIASSTDRNNALVDLTGCYLDTNPYDANSSSKTEGGARPTGDYCKYDFFYTDYAMTQTSDRIPDLTINGGSVDTEALTASYNVAAGTQSVGLTLGEGITARYYYSDADFSNIDNIDTATAVSGQLPTGNLSNYYIVQVFSFDQLSYKLYKLTITKDRSTAAPLNRVTRYSPSAATLTQDGNYWYAGIPQDASSFTFGITYGPGCVAVVMDGDTRLTASMGRYTVNNIDTTQREITITITSPTGDETEIYRLFIQKEKRHGCELLDIQGDGLNTVSDTEFETTIPFTQDSYTFTMQISDGASAVVWSGTSVFAYNNETGEVVIDEIQAGKAVYNILITAEDGTTTKAFTLTIDRVLNDQAELISIEGAQKDGDSFTVEATGSFTINANVSAGASYKVYSDAALTNEISNTVPVTVSDQVVYIVVTAQNGVNKSEPYRLTIQSRSGFEIENAVYEDGGYVINAADDLSSYRLTVNTKNAEYTLYADSELNFEAGNTINLAQGETIVYIRVTYSDDTSATYPVLIWSKRSATNYKDASSIAGWAKEYVDGLNESGYGLLVGDDNRNFNPTASMTRYEIAVVAVKLMGADATKFSNVRLNFSDTIAGWAQNYVKAAYTLGLMSGNDNGGKITFDGQNPTQRQQFARIFMEVICTGGMGMSASEYYEQNQAAIDAAYSEYSFEDENTVQTWAKPYVKLMVISGFMSGSLNNGKYYIEGQKSIVRQEVAVILGNALLQD